MKILAFIFRFIVSGLILASASSYAEEEFLDVDQAFNLNASWDGSGVLLLDWTIAKHYYMYRKAFAIESQPNLAITLAPLPKGISKFDENFNETVEIFHDQVSFKQPLPKITEKTWVAVKYRGCAEAGLCYPPTTKWFAIDTNTPAGVLTAVPEPTSLTQDLPAEAAPQKSADTATTTTNPSQGENQTQEANLSAQSRAQAILASGSVLKIAFAFFVFGLLLSFTPCVLPMIPILSSIIVGRGQPVSRGKGLLLALSYTLGMALVYTALGVGAGLLGTSLAAALQKPWVLISFATLLVLLAMSMFDFYQLQLPSFIQSKLSSTSDKQSGGRLFGVFVMGAISALIVGPCVAAPLAGALLYISQTGNAVLGGFALFCMALGMGVPLLLTGLSAGSLLPKAGSWMDSVKYLFGLLLIAVAIWMVNPIVNAQVNLALWGSWAILSAVFLGVFSGQHIVTNAQKMTRALGIVMLLMGTFLWLGAVSGGQDIFQPLKQLAGDQRSMGSTSTKNNNQHLNFQSITTTAQLDSLLSRSEKPVMLDFYADWCVACIEMEKFTFSDAGVQKALSHYTLLQVDVTNNTADDKAFYQKFGLFGPPAILFFAPQKGQAATEVSQARVIGFLQANEFIKEIKKVPQE